MQVMKPIACVRMTQFHGNIDLYSLFSFH